MIISIAMHNQKLAQAYNLYRIYCIQMVAFDGSREEKMK